MSTAGSKVRDFLSTHTQQLLTSDVRADAELMAVYIATLDEVVVPVDTAYAAKGGLQDKVNILNLLLTAHYGSILRSFCDMSAFDPQAQVKIVHFCGELNYLLKQLFMP